MTFAVAKAWSPYGLTVAAVALCFACGSSKNPAATGGTGGTNGGSAGSGSGGEVDVPPTMGIMGPPNCGLDSAAFCDGFDKPATNKGRAGDLDIASWSMSRLSPLGPTDMMKAFPIGAALLPKCREGSPMLAWPEDDNLVCDPIPAIKNSHLLMAVAAQNYGENSLRIRQPFDFAGRTGKIVFDAQGYSTLGWISLEVTDEPTGVPSYGTFVNDEGGVFPKNGFEIQFSDTCGMGGEPTVFGWRTFHEFKDYVDTVTSRSGFDCPSAKKGYLNHFEVTVSQKKVEVSVSPYSEDGVNFGELKQVLSVPVSLPFTRGYVHITTHNHATLKYSTADHAGNQGETDLNAWIAPWDNVGFDGVILKDTREYEAPDSLTETTSSYVDPHNPTMKAINIGYIAPDVATGQSPPIKIAGVSLDKAKSAELALTAWYPGDNQKIDGVVLKYRFNGGAWRDRPVNAAEAAHFNKPQVINGGGTPGILNAIGQIIDIDLADLVEGDNTVEFATENSPQGMPPGVANIDLILKLEQ